MRTTIDRLATVSRTVGGAVVTVVLCVIVALTATFTDASAQPVTTRLAGGPNAAKDILVADTAVDGHASRTRIHTGA